MALLITPDGTRKKIEPDRGKTFSLQKLQELVEGYIEIVPHNGPKIFIVNEEGIIKGLPYNCYGTMGFFTESGHLTHLFGNVLILEPSELE